MGKKMSLFLIMVVCISLENPLVFSGRKNFPNVIVDGRVELLGLIFRLAGNPEYNQCKIPSYKKDVETHFGRYKNHPAVKLARQLRKKRGISYDAVMSLAIHIKGPYTLLERVPFEPFPKELDKRWTTVEAREFLDNVRHFVKQTKFKEFFYKHKKLYETAVSRMKKVLHKHGHFNWFDHFFGLNPGANFTVILGMLNGGASYGVKIKPTGSGEKLYSVLGVWLKDEKGSPMFDRRVLPTVIHEFCHSYINPLVTQYESRLEKAGKTIFPYVAEDMKKMAYNNWKAMMSESLVRACVVRYLAVNNGPMAEKEQILIEIRNKFIWIEELSNLLKFYETRRGTYPNPDSFFPRIVDFFNKYSSSKKEKLAAIEKEKEKQWKPIKKKL